MPLDGAVILDRHFDAPLVGNAQKGHIPGNRLQRPNLNVSAGDHFHRPQSPGLELGAGGQRLRRGGSGNGGGGGDGGGVRGRLRGGYGLRLVAPAAGGGRQNQRHQYRRDAPVPRTNFHFPCPPVVRLGAGPRTPPHSSRVIFQSLRSRPPTPARRPRPILAGRRDKPRFILFALPEPGLRPAATNGRRRRPVPESSPGRNRT